MTFVCLIESKGSVEGERGDLSKNIAKEVVNEGSTKEASSLGLVGDPKLDKCEKRDNPEGQ